LGVGASSAVMRGRGGPASVVLACTSACSATLSVAAAVAPGSASSAVAKLSVAVYVESVVAPVPSNATV
jgi:hypothetical protein